MLNKYTTAAQAKKFNDLIQSNHQSEIQSSIQSTQIYSPDSTFNNIDTSHNSTTSTPLNQEIEVADIDSVSAVFHYTSPTSHTALLNFASYKNPGGRFLDGSMAQEEAICHKSTLYPVLESFSDKYYMWNRNNLNKGLYLNRALYSKDILFFNGTNSTKCDVITCAAPNNSIGIKYKSFTPEDNSAALKSRIHFLLDIAHEQQVDTIILGAYGCGVFRQSPTEVATIFKEYLSEHKYFDKVIFAVPADKSSKNFNSFKSILVR